MLFGLGAVIPDKCDDIVVSGRFAQIKARVGCDFFDGAIGMKKAEETIGKPVFWQLPNDPKAMMSSRNAGVPLLQHAPRSKIQQSIASLADTLCGKGAAEDDKKKRSGFFSFRS